MSAKIFDDAFQTRLAVTIRAVEQEALEPNDPQPLEAEDYEAIYDAYQESGGDPIAARKQIAGARAQCDQAFSRILQFIADQYGFGAIEGLGDDALKDVARDGVNAAECWMEDVEMHDRAAKRDGPLQLLLKTHYQFNEAMFDMRDEILWPLVKRISPRP
jgi:hypothetical protein